MKKKKKKKKKGIFLRNRSFFQIILRSALTNYGSPQETNHDYFPEKTGEIKQTTKCCPVCFFSVFFFFVFVNFFLPFKWSVWLILMKLIKKLRKFLKLFK